MKETQTEIAGQEAKRVNLEKEQAELQKEYEAIILKIADSGYAAMEKDLESLNEALERLQNSKARWKKTADGLKEWKEKDVTPNQTLWDIDRFVSGKITEGELERLQTSLTQIRGRTGRRASGDRCQTSRGQKEEKAAREELKELKQGRKAYPKELEEARYELRNRLHEKCGKFVNVQILADLLDVRDERWHNAIEGYLGKQQAASSRGNQSTRKLPWKSIRTWIRRNFSGQQSGYRKKYRRQNGK